MKPRTFEITVRFTQEELTEIVTSYLRQCVVNTHNNNKIEDQDYALELHRLHLNKPPVIFGDITFFPVETAPGDLHWRAENANGDVLFFVAEPPLI